LRLFHRQPAQLRFLVAFSHLNDRRADARWHTGINNEEKKQTRKRTNNPKTKTNQINKTKQNKTKQNKTKNKTK
jgi:hypothetical protein